MSRGAERNGLSELEDRAAAYNEWHAAAGMLVPDADALLSQAKRALAHSAVRRAKLAFLQESDDLGLRMFDGLCEFALENDPGWAAAEVERLREMRGRVWSRRIRNVILPATKLAARARKVLPHVRARVHVI